MLIPGFEHRSYLALARELLVCPPNDEQYQAKLRSAISRAYYAVFLHAKFARGIDDDNRHGDVIAWLRQINKDWGQDANELKVAREDCDYDRPIRYDIGNKAQECIDSADELIDHISEHSTSP